MKVLFVGSNNGHNGFFAPFITEQGDALCKTGCEVEYFGVVGKGIKGYLKALKPLKYKINDFKPDIIHAHYGLCGLLTNLQRQVPVVTTYHGSDINVRKVLRFSKIAMRLSAWNIFVDKRTMAIAHSEKLRNVSLLPCGINLPQSQEKYPDINHVLEKGKKHVLFAGAFDNAVKDPGLAKQVVALLSDAQLIELKGYNRDEVNALMYVCDAFLMTSKTEGSPQVVKEAMACGLPIVSVDVGDVRERTIGLGGCYIAHSREPQELAELLLQAVAYGKTDGYQHIVKMGLSSDLVASKLIEIYQSLLKK